MDIVRPGTKSYTPPGPTWDGRSGGRPVRDPNALPVPFMNPDQLRELSFNSTDSLIDPNVRAHWARWEGQHQFPSYDPAVAYGQGIAVALEADQRDFYVGENPFHPAHVYMHNLQQVPGSMYKVDAASWDPYETPQVINRFSYLSRAAAAYVVDQLNQEMRKNHPCFSLSGREHFEQSYPPMSCGDPLGQKASPIALIRVFESRVKKTDKGQEIYLNLELGNMIAAGAGGMYAVTVFQDKHGKFCSYTPLVRSQLHQFVLPRTRGTSCGGPELAYNKVWSGAGSIHGAG